MRTAMLAVALPLLALSACGDSGDSPIVPVHGIRVTPQSLVLPALGATSELLATIQPANATDQALTWESTDASVVSVDADGVVTARAVGSGVFVTAITHDGHFQSSANVSVNP